MNNNNKKALALPIALRPILLLIAGGLLPLSLAPWHWWPMGIFSSAALVLLLQGSNAKQAYWRTFVFAFGMFVVGASWVYVSMNVYGNASVALSLLLTGLFVTALALIAALPFLLYGKFCGHNRTATLVAFPAIWVLSEWGLSWILTGFPWVYLGYGHLYTWLAGWAPVTGVWGISWIVAFSGATLALWLHSVIPALSVIPAKAGQKHEACWAPEGRVKRTIQKQRKPLHWALAVATTLWLGGFGLQQIDWTKPTDKTVTVGLLQPNIPQQLRWEPGRTQQIISDNLTLNELLWGNDIIVWPESAIPQLRHRIEPLLAQLGAKAKQSGATFITGIPVYDFDQKRYLNSVIANGNGSGQYNKQHLVPFGEYVPLENMLRGLIDFFDLPMSAFSAGSADQPLITAGEQRIGTAICYEIAFPELVRQVSKEASVLLTVSNDTWFGDSLGPQQHFSMAQMRALENGKPLIRATNDGITALIDYRGNTTHWLPQFTSGTLSGELTPRVGSTPFGNLGSWPVLLLVLLSLLATLWIQRPQKA